MPEPTVRLTDEQIDFFHREGYLQLDALTTPEDAAMCREAYDRIFAERAGREEGNQFDLAGADEDGKEAALPQILGPARYAPELNDSLLLANATAITKQLLGDDAKCSIGHAIFKPAGHGAATPWHQDAAYWPPQFIHKSISIWAPLQEATIENGCMHFVPRSHELDVIPHRPINNDPRIHGLEVQPDQMHHVKNVVACPLPAGGCTIHGGYMLHYTPPNRSNVPRRALILSGSGKNEPREQPVRFPWLEDRQTARQQRAAAAAAQGSDRANTNA